MNLTDNVLTQTDVLVKQLVKVLYLEKLKDLKTKYKLLPLEKKVA